MQIIRRWLVALALVLVWGAAPALAGGNHSAQKGHSSSIAKSSAKSTSKPKKAKKKSAAKATRPPVPPHANRCTGCDRDAHGRILRSGKARKAFESATGYPHGRPGYVIDHIQPLACGGADIPSNMQWQTKDAAKAKDKTERAGCR